MARFNNYAYSGMDYQEYHNFPHPLGTQWSDIGMTLLFFIYIYELFFFHNILFFLFFKEIYDVFVMR
jgi:hypothetical protein